MGEAYSDIVFDNQYKESNPGGLESGRGMGREKLIRIGVGKLKLEED